MSFRLIRKGLQQKTFQGQHTWPLEVQAVSTNPSLPAEIFCYRRGQDGQAAFAGDLFTNVASVLDMQEMGLEPTLLESGDFQPCFRRDTLIFHCRTPLDCDELFEDVVEDVKDLIRNTNSLNQLATEVTLEL